MRHLGTATTRKRIFPSLIINYFFLIIILVRNCIPIVLRAIEETYFRERHPFKRLSKPSIFVFLEHFVQRLCSNWKACLVCILAGRTLCAPRTIPGVCSHIGFLCAQPQPLLQCQGKENCAHRKLHIVSLVCAMLNATQHKLHTLQSAQSMNYKTHSL